ncbi:hypothetical protein TI39_contig614g00011 [Zymoseptoria brevis]|uniref:Aminoglycoside phosphotransferase domain-containing protein n=1 Tax=Zymoseptoria brevis TaxID=1047168 RepID=A0A0F4GGQ4_9PEZI|nr:hypothetical protein TI39_contig614g00011 [Zymoseptoria brevis]
MEANGELPPSGSEPLGGVTDERPLTRTLWCTVLELVSSVCAKAGKVADWSAYNAAISQTGQDRSPQLPSHIASKASEAFVEAGSPLELDSTQVRGETADEANEANEEQHSYPLENEPLTRENILKCLPTAPVVPQPGFECTVARIRSDVVVKYGSERVRVNEANTMRLVQQRTSSVLLPEVLDAWTTAADPERFPSEVFKPFTPITYIVMHYVPGLTLQDKWPLMTEPERKLLVRRIADMIKDLRTIEMDQPGPVGEPIRCEGLFFTDYNAGPFETKDDLAYWLNNRLRVCKDFRRIPEDRPELVIDRLVMCHLDLNERNIIVAEDGSPWLIDWGCAGGYPPCFERGHVETQVGDFARMLEREIFAEEDEPLLARLKEMMFAFTTGALSHRYDMDSDDESE